MNWNWFVLKSNKIKITKDNNKFTIDEVKAIHFMFVAETPLSLLTIIPNTPNIGIKSKDNNNIKKKKIITSIVYNDILSLYLKKHHKYIKVTGQLGGIL